MGAFDYTTNGVTMPVQSCMIPRSGQPADMSYSTTICKLVDLISALHQSDWRIPNWVSAKTVLSCSTNHGQTTARFRSFFR